MRLDDLKYFVEVARCKSINQAAQNLYLTQPALTMALNSLEEELGYKLLIRSHQGTFLTTQGEQVFNDAQRILDIASGWHALNESTANSCTLHIGANPAAYNFLLVPLQVNLQESHANLNIFSYELKNQKILPALEKGSISIGIISVLPNEEADFNRQLKQKKLVAHQLYVDRLDVFTKGDSHLASQICLTTKDLSNESLALYPEQDDTIAGPYYSNFFNNGKLYHLSSLNNILQVIESGKAVGIFPKIMVENSPQAKSGHIVALPLCDYQMPLTYYLVTRTGDHQFGTQKEVIDTIIDICSHYAIMSPIQTTFPNP